MTEPKDSCSTARRVHPIARRLLGLCIPPVALKLLDAGLTLHGQSASYWGGNYTQVNELSPTFHYWLSIHPLVYISGIGAWIVLSVLLILFLPAPLALAACIAQTIGSTWGATTWLIGSFENGYQLSNGLFGLTGLLLAIGILYGWRANLQSDRPLGASLPPIVRLAFVILLFAVEGYMFILPRSV